MSNVVLLDVPTTSALSVLVLIEAVIAPAGRSTTLLTAPGSATSYGLQASSESLNALPVNLTCSVALAFIT
jgi:hypothetical protein